MAQQKHINKEEFAESHNESVRYNTVNFSNLEAEALTREHSCTDTLSSPGETQGKIPSNWTKDNRVINIATEILSRLLT